MAEQLNIDTRFCTDQPSTGYAHVGLFDVQQQRLWAARDRQDGPSAIQISHASLLVGGTDGVSTAEKDRFMCTWFNPPASGQGLVQGYPIEWEEAHVMVRLDPNWNYLTRQFIASTDSAKVERNIKQQYEWGRKIFEMYLAAQPPFPVSWHMIGPRATDSMFYIRRVAPPEVPPEPQEMSPEATLPQSGRS